MTAPIRVDTPISDLRNGLQILSLASVSITDAGAGCRLTAQQLKDLTDRIMAAIAKLEAKAAADKTILAGLRRIEADIHRNREELETDVELRGLGL